MRKWFWGALLALALLLPVLPACAQTWVFDQLYATMEVPDTYTVLTPDNVASFADWLTARNTSSEDAANDMLARGVLLQCWNTDGDVCFELTATQSDQAKNIFDVNEQSSSMRAQYRLGHYPENLYLDQGFEFSSADWKNTQDGRFLILRYVKSDNGVLNHRGLMRRTIRNGYEITFDLQVYNRSITNKDNTALNKLWETFHFVEVQPLPAAASAKVSITEAPPTETSEKDFNLAGTAAPGVKFTAVVMGLSYPTPTVSETDVGTSGKFKIPISLPKEGVFMVTVTAEYNGEDVMELAYPVTYQRTLLTVNVTTEVPAVVTADTFSILGQSTPGAQIQVFVNDELVDRKKVTAAGRFKIDLDTAEEGDYAVVLVFNKTGLADRRVNYQFTRKWSETDMVKRLQSEAIKPGYNTLVSKIDGYVGRTMGYKCYLVEKTQSGDGWILKMALTKKNSGYSGVFLVTTDEETTLAVDTRVMMYGRCTGMSEPATDAEGTADTTAVTYPVFELLLLSAL